MTIWYVRPDTSHSGTRNGTSYDTAWGGWSAVVWGASGVKGGDVLYVCGVHVLTNYIQTGVHNGAAGSPATISGGYGPDPGTLVFTPGSFFFLVGKDYTTVEDLTLRGGTSHSFYLYPTAELKGVTIRRCNLIGGVGNAIIGISASDGQSFSDLMISDCDFTGGTGAPLGGAISWTVAASGLPVSSLTRVTIHNNRFTECTGDRAVVQLRMETGANAAATMADIVITDNVFRDCPTLAMEIIGPALTGFPEYYGRNTGLRITGNKFYNMTANDLEFNLGGAMGIGGFGPSLTSGFGSNVIARNEAYWIEGPSGFLNLFYGTFRVFDNYGEDIYASQADGNAILIDHGCVDTVCHNNYFRRVMGHPDAENSGCGFMILNSTGNTVYGNVIDGCKIGVYIGNKTIGQSCNVYNNTFKDCTFAGYYALSTADMAANLIRNNIFTGAPSVPSVLIKGGTMTGESGNCYHGFTNPVGHTLHASNITDNPELDGDYRPAAAALTGTGTYLGGKDWTGKTFYNPPNIGAVDVLPMAPRYALRQR